MSQLLMRLYFESFGSSEGVYFDGSTYSFGSQAESFGSAT